MATYSVSSIDYANITKSRVQATNPKLVTAALMACFVFTQAPSHIKSFSTSSSLVRRVEPAKLNFRADGSVYRNTSFQNITKFKSKKNLGSVLREIRARAIAKGLILSTIDEINEELRGMRR